MLCRRGAARHRAGLYSRGEYHVKTARTPVDRGSASLACGRSPYAGSGRAGPPGSKGEIVQKLVDTVRESLWFMPALWVVTCAAGAFGLVALDQAAPELSSSVPLVFGGGPESARGLLSSIASSMITVVGVVFSITIVALQLASSQYSPRVLRSFMRDRPSQIVLGSFIGAFVYSVLVLRTVRSDDEQGAQFVPGLAVTGAVLLAVVAVGMLVFFVHHIASRMQVSQIVASVAEEALTELNREAREDQRRARQGATRDATGVSRGPSRERDSVVVAHESGYLQYVDIDGLTALAERHDVVVRIEVPAGGWVQRHAPLFSVWGTAPTDLGEELHREITVATQRVVYQDPEFALQQLVDIAVKALSPGINDPTTAINALHRITEVLVAAGRAGAPRVEHPGADGAVRLIAPKRDFAALLRTAFGEIGHFGSDQPRVRGALRDALTLLELTVDPAQRPAVAGEARALIRAGADATGGS